MIRKNDSGNGKQLLHLLTSITDGGEEKEELNISGVRPPEPFKIRGVGGGGPNTEVHLRGKGREGTRVCR